MDLVQDVIVGSVTGLAIRGVRRLVFGPSQNSQAVEVAGLQENNRRLTAQIERLEQIIVEDSRRKRKRDALRADRPPHRHKRARSEDPSSSEEDESDDELSSDNDTSSAPSSKAAKSEDSSGSSGDSEASDSSKETRSSSDSDNGDSHSMESQPPINSSSTSSDTDTASSDTSSSETRSGDSGASSEVSSEDSEPSQRPSAARHDEFEPSLEAAHVGEGDSSSDPSTKESDSDEDDLSEDALDPTASYEAMHETCSASGSDEARVALSEEELILQPPRCSTPSIGASSSFSSGATSSSSSGLSGSHSGGTSRQLITLDSSSDVEDEAELQPQAARCHRKLMISESSDTESDREERHDDPSEVVVLTSDAASDQEAEGFTKEDMPIQACDAEAEGEGALQILSHPPSPATLSPAPSAPAPEAEASQSDEGTDEGIAENLELAAKPTLPVESLAVAITEEDRFLDSQEIPEAAKTPKAAKIPEANQKQADKANNSGLVPTGVVDGSYDQDLSDEFDMDLYHLAMGLPPVDPAVAEQSLADATTAGGESKLPSTPSLCTPGIAIGISQGRWIPSTLRAKPFIRKCRPPRCIKNRFQELFQSLNQRLNPFGRLSSREGCSQYPPNTNLHDNPDTNASEEMCVAHARDARCKAETLHHPHAIPAQELLDRAEAGSAAVKAVARAASQISSLDKAFRLQSTACPIANSRLTATATEKQPPMAAGPGAVGQPLQAPPADTPLMAKADLGRNSQDVLQALEGWFATEPLPLNPASQTRLPSTRPCLSELPSLPARTDDAGMHQQVDVAASSSSGIHPQQQEQQQQQQTAAFPGSIEELFRAAAAPDSLPSCSRAPTTIPTPPQADVAAPAPVLLGSPVWSPEPHVTGLGQTAPAAYLPTSPAHKWAFMTSWAHPPLDGPDAGFPPRRALDRPTSPVECIWPEAACSNILSAADFPGLVLDIPPGRSQNRESARRSRTACSRDCRDSIPEFSGFPPAPQACQGLVTRIASYFPTSVELPAPTAYSPTSPAYSPTSPAYPQRNTPGYSPTSPAYSPPSPAYSPMSLADSPQSQARSPSPFPRPVPGEALGSAPPDDAHRQSQSPSQKAQERDLQYYSPPSPAYSPCSPAYSRGASPTPQDLDHEIEDEEISQLASSAVPSKGPCPSPPCMSEEYVEPLHSSPPSNRSHSSPGHSASRSPSPPRSAILHSSSPQGAASDEQKASDGERAILCSKSPARSLSSDKSSERHSLSGHSSPAETQQESDREYVSHSTAPDIPRASSKGTSRKPDSPNLFNSDSEMKSFLREYAKATSLSWCRPKSISCPTSSSPCQVASMRVPSNYSLKRQPERQRRRAVGFPSVTSGLIDEGPSQEGTPERIFRDLRRSSRVCLPSPQPTDRSDSEHIARFGRGHPGSETVTNPSVSSDEDKEQQETHRRPGGRSRTRSISRWRGSSPVHRDTPFPEVRRDSPLRHQKSSLFGRSPPYNDICRGGDDMNPFSGAIPFETRILRNRSRSRSPVAKGPSSPAWEGSEDRPTPGDSETSLPGRSASLATSVQGLLQESPDRGRLSPALQLQSTGAVHQAEARRGSESPDSARQTSLSFFKLRGLAVAGVSGGNLQAYNKDMDHTCCPATGPEAEDAEAGLQQGLDLAKSNPTSSKSISWAAKGHRLASRRGSPSRNRSPMARSQDGRISSGLEDSAEDSDLQKKAAAADSWAEALPVGGHRAQEDREDILDEFQVACIMLKNQSQALQNGRASGRAAGHSERPSNSTFCFGNGRSGKDLDVFVEDPAIIVLSSDSD